MKLERKMVHIATCIDRKGDLVIEHVFTEKGRAEDYLKRRQKEEKDVPEGLRSSSFKIDSRPLIEESIMRKAFSY